MPQAGSDKSLRTGTETSVNLQVSWTDPKKVNQLGVHDMYVIAIDNSINLLEGDENDLTPMRVSKFILMCSCVFVFV